MQHGSYTPNVTLNGKKECDNRLLMAAHKHFSLLPVNERIPLTFWLAGTWLFRLKLHFPAPLNLGLAIYLSSSQWDEIRRDPHQSCLLSTSFPSAVGIEHRHGGETEGAWTQGPLLRVEPILSSSTNSYRETIPPAIVWSVLNNWTTLLTNTSCPWRVDFCAKCWVV